MLAGANAITTVYPVKSAVFHTPAGRWSTTGLSIVNTREALLDLTDGLEDAAIDKYSYTRDLYMKVRSRQTGGTLPQGEDDNIDIDELVDSELPVEAGVDISNTSAGDTSDLYLYTPIQTGVSADDTAND